MASLNDVLPGSSADSSCIQQVIDVLKGTAGSGNIPVSLTAINDASNYALDVRNQDGVNARALRVLDSLNLPQLDISAGVVNIFNVVVSGGTLDTVIMTGGTVLTSVIDLNAASSNTMLVPFAYATNGSSLTLSTASNLLSFTNENVDSDGIFSTATPTFMAPTRSGVWSVGASVQYRSSNSSAYCVLAIVDVNGGSTFIHAGGQIGKSSAQPATVRVIGDLVLTSTSHVGVRLIHSTANAGRVDAESNPPSCDFWMTYRGALST